MIYVKLRSALSICETCPAFLVMKSSYMASHFGGIARICPAADAGGCGFGNVDWAGIVGAAHARERRDL